MAFVGDRLEEFARAHPGRTALTCGPARLSFQALFQKIGLFADLITRVSGQGGRIALNLHDPVDLLLGVFACARAGRIAVVLDPEAPAPQTRSILDAVGPELVIEEGGFSDLLARDKEGAGAGRTRTAGHAPGRGDLFYAGFTSGSSGLPKGYVRSHGSWLDSFALSERAFGIAPQSRIVVPGRLSHSLHLYGAVCGLACGQEVVLVPRFDPRGVLSLLAVSEAGAALYATPTQLHLLAEAARRSGPLGTVRQVLASGAKWHDADRKALRSVFPAAGLFEFYGASETSFITISGPQDTVPDGSVGRAAEGVRVRIGDPEDPSPVGVTGPVWVKSGLLFSGYLVGASATTRWRDGWLTVGDQGWLDNNGFLFLTGRENRMLVSSGLNVYPEEVETVLETHPAVAAAVVVGLEDRLRGERLEAVVRLKTSSGDVAEDLNHHCRTRLAAGKVPRVFHVWDHLPLTAGGKPDIQKITAALKAAGEKT